MLLLSVKTIKNNCINLIKVNEMSLRMLNKNEINSPINKETVSIEEHIRSFDFHNEYRSCITFDYKLNDRATKSELI